MRVAFDMDGVLADLHTAFSAVARRLCPDLDPVLLAAPDTGSSPPATIDEASGEDDPPAEVEQSVRLPLTRRQSDAVWRELGRTENFWETLAEIESGAIARLAQLAHEHRWETLFITSRPHAPGVTVQLQSQRWLQRHGFQLPSVFVVHGSRGLIAEALALDVVVDDRPENCLDVALESRARSILVWRGTQASVPASAKRLGIGVVPTVAGCLDMLVEAQRAADTPADLRERLRRLLGLKTRPASPGIR
jgi:phosphoglycolate phosphatase-like HAD superfamily hydrolase